MNQFPSRVRFPAEIMPPLKVPWIIKDGFAWTAVLFVLAIPMAIILPTPVLWLGRWLFGSQELVPSWYETAVLVGIGGPVLLSPFWAGLFVAFSRTSSFILKCVRCHLDNGDKKKAEAFALRVDYQIWFREWRQNPWFRKFLVEQGLIDKSARFAEFNQRKPG